MAKYKLISFDKIPSTQTYAHELIARGRGADHVAILAEAQSAGRGRYQRKWVSHHGNLYVSFIFAAKRKNPHLSYAVAVAVADTIESFGVRPTIKWPNDILIDGKKVCGILIEYSDPFVIIGIGININTNPTVSTYQTTKLQNYAPVTRDQLLARLMQNLDKWLVADFASVRGEWMARAVFLNKTVMYQGQPAELIEIDENGALVMRRDGKNIVVYGDEIII